MKIKFVLFSLLLCSPYSTVSAFELNLFAAETETVDSDKEAESIENHEEEQIGSVSRIVANFTILINQGWEGS